MINYIYYYILMTSVIKIQAIWRGYYIRSKMHKSGIIAMFGVFATMIQSTWRGYSWRKNNIIQQNVVNERAIIQQEVRWQRGTTLRALK